MDSNSLGDSNAIELIGKIVVIAVVLLLFVVVFVFCIHIYARWVLSRRHGTDTTTTTTRRRRRFDFAGGHQEIAVVPPARRGLDPSVLKTIPITVFSHQEHSKDGLECAVCLSEVSEGEKARFLPKCNHGFHADCIDMWFKSHSTCPICRNLLVSDQSQTNNPSTVAGEVPDSVGNVLTTDAANFPTNVLVWGDDVTVSRTNTAAAVSAPCVDDQNHDQPSSSSSSPSMVVIDIPSPRQINGEEQQELKSPVLTRLRSLTRLFSGNSRRVNNVCSPRNLDVEQGGGVGQG